MTKSTKTGEAKLGDVELILLASAGRHDDHLIAIPGAMKPVTRQRAAGNLIKRRFAEERAARANDPIWREDENGRFTLAATTVGLAAVGIEDGPQDADSEVAKASGAAPVPAVDASQPREGTKGALVISLLVRPSGAGIDELTAATGWLPHTTRAALTGLRKRGYAIERSAGEGGSVYRIAPTEPPPATRGRKAVAKAA